MVGRDYERDGRSVMLSLDEETRGNYSRRRRRASRYLDRIRQ